MSVQNPTIPTATQAKGIDAAVNDLQTALSFDLSWLTNGMGRAYRKNKTRSNNVSQYLPMVYLGTNFANDFFNATPDNDKEGQSIILVGDATPIEYQTGFYGWLEYPISIIFSANLDTIDSALLATEDFTEHLMEDVRDSLRGLLGKSYRLAVTNETREFEDVYSEFDIGVDTTNKAFLPMTYFRFECTMLVKEDCGNNTLNRCAAILQNLTSADLLSCILPTYDFSNATTQAAVTAQQQTDLTSWLCGGGGDFAMSFDGATEYISYPVTTVHDFIDYDVPWTLNARIKTDSTGVFQCVYGKYLNVSSGPGFIFRVGLDNALNLMFFVGSTQKMWVYTTTFLTVGQVYDITATYDGGGANNAAGVKIYFDSVAQPLSILGNNLVSSIVDTRALLIGRYDAGALFSGIIDNIEAWNVELTPTQILAVNSGADTLPANKKIGNNMGDNALFGTEWVFPDTTGLLPSNPYSVNMDLTNRVAGI
jgi:hypothetical protein